MIVAQSRRTLLEGVRRTVRVLFGALASIVVVSFSVADWILPRILGVRARFVRARGAARGR